MARDIGRDNEKRHDPHRHEPGQALVACEIGAAGRHGIARRRSSCCRGPEVVDEHGEQDREGKVDEDRVAVLESLAPV